MRVLWKPELKIQKCEHCGAELQITYEDLRIEENTLRKDIIFFCKVCESKNVVNFDKGE